MSAHAIHEQGHDHQHGAECGHVAVPHDDHVDFLHDGHVHHEHDGHYDEHDVDVTARHLVAEGHDHQHGPDCGHESVEHDGHVDYVHGLHRHAAHADHYDEH